jgi:hypothetical protein
VCLCIPPPHLVLNTWTNLYEIWYVFHGTSAHLNGVLHKSRPSVSVSACVFLLSSLGNGSVKCTPPFCSRQQLGKHVPAAKNTNNKRRIIGRVIFCVVRVLSKESLWVCQCIPLSLLGNGSVTTFPRQRRVVVGVVFYAIRLISKENRRLILLRTSSYLYICSCLYSDRNI